MDVYDKPEAPNLDVIANLGPLAPLVGNWVGDQGLDVSPAREGAVETKYREECHFEAMGPVVNGPQVLYGLRYFGTMWPIGDDDPFHEEMGYWMWDAKAQMIMRGFMIPRPVVCLAGGEAEPNARGFKLECELGSGTFGVLSSPFLDEAFQTVRFEMKVTIHDDESFTYEEDTVLKIFGSDELFHHTDRNTLRRA